MGVGVVGRMCCGSQTNLEHNIDSVPDEVSWVVFVCHGLFSVLYRQYMGCLISMTKLRNCIAGIWINFNNR